MALAIGKFRAAAQAEASGDYSGSFN